LSSTDITIDSARLWQRLMDLARFTDPESPWTRRGFTPLFLEGRAWLTEQFAAAGLAPRLDAAGNLIGRLAGSDADAPPILIGSHSDTVPAGGRFDGMLGLLAALEVAQSISEAGVTTRHPIEVVDFLSEEPSDFGLSCIGSRALSGQLTAEMLERTRPDGMTLREGIAYVGGRPADLDSAKRATGSIAAYLEVHIEQGRVLETSGTDVGVVTAIAGIRRDQLVVEGQADHAGTTPMTLRRDALVGAARVIDLVNRHARDRPEADQLVATIGKMTVSPNAANAVPGRVEMVLEARAGDARVIDAFVDEVLAAAREATESLELSLQVDAISKIPPTPCASALQDVIEAAARERGLSTRRMPSGAGHDGVFVAPLGPIGMIFTPCRDGRSHCPEEWADERACADGATALLGATLRLDESLRRF
jgi:N-carbamoyl-L-amino-acid hydrolase